MNGEIKRCFAAMRGIDYNHREGGRYAYLQMMAYLRELRVLIADEVPSHHVLHWIDGCSELLNALVPLRFGAEHQWIFQKKTEELATLERRLTGVQMVEGEKTTPMRAVEIPRHEAVRVSG